MHALARTTPRTLATVVALAAAFIAAAVGLFKLTVGGAIALYFVLWWTLLFAILPLRNQPETRAERIVPGQDLGAPALPRLREKAVWTTLFAGAALLAALAVFPLAGL
jgi:predicted secreted protein